ncbi:family S53 protease-like protein [Lentinus tigrinus ALCF2SS1-7]|uniref:tripeptidyl-peptidase II n=1 Tax=Lentinus tigrinus ALCF2SS1-6 TaxID=1328759 RepID=A0A5C2RUH4_9APHY|nr:family S53 protease-like protein [Lentinus tigrinus ALCF2SS1-6]RPD69206.1 family S53 protease-like protein [Lentinus tigrinus ALCF2SS1-7]
MHPASPSSSIQLTLVLPPTNIDGLHTALYDVSDPKSANYGKYLSKAEVEAFVAPKPDSVKAVTDWLGQHNIHSQTVSPSGDMLRIDVPVSTANTLLAANFTVFKDQSSNVTLTRTLSVTIPDDVAPYLEFIYPTTQFITPLQPKNPHFEVVTLPPKSKRQLPDFCAFDVIPQCLEGYYHIPSAPANATGNSIGVSGYLDEIPSEQDLQIFFDAWRPNITTVPEFSIVSIDGGITSGAGTVEASLDIQYTVGVATGVPTTFYSVGDATAQGFIDLANFLLGLDEVPLVLTTSYSFFETQFEGTGTLPETFCNVYSQLGARGTTVIFSSGDWGVYSLNFDGSCDTTAFGATFPSTCPFVTSVGATTGFDGPEVAANFSGGGFSNFFPRPDYQSTTVQNYLNTIGTLDAGLFNSSGRAFPDISAQGVRYLTEVNGTFLGIDGTSASAPVIASVVALLNDARLNAGLPSLGFLNPLLYSQGAAALNDVTSGSNPGCGPVGFPAVEGWDPVTGLGSPDFDKLLALVMGAQPDL